MSEREADPAVEIVANGPYRVKGGVPLARTAQVETEYGEPVDWAPFEPLETPEPVELCRCGLTATQPFCDHACDTNGFDGTEVAAHGTYAERAYPYRGDGLTLHDERTLCSTAGYCGDRFTNVWAMIGKTDDPEIRERIRHMTRLCPSGRIVTQPEGEGMEEPDFEPSIGAVKDGPFWVRGRIPVVGADGTPYEVRNRETLCRCGHSRNKPFCDGSHKDVGFADG
ncbi:MAG: CDGSH iron-sulfur domain-containing protein [Actinomycetota bacterium]